MALAASARPFLGPLIANRDVVSLQGERAVAIVATPATARVALRLFFFGVLIPCLTGMVDLYLRHITL